MREFSNAMCELSNAMEELSQSSHALNEAFIIEAELPWQD
jgi:hypothetical protein